MKLNEAFTKSLLVYHGTSFEKWQEEQGEKTTLYVTVNEEAAQKYAHEWFDSNGEIPVVIVFDLKDVLNDGLVLEPNWETVDRMGDMTWEESLALTGTCCITGDINKIKNAEKTKIIRLGK